jgi:glycosyltransferase involved in cell wall biosynthesis
MGPKVSVIMAVLNGERFIDEAIQSIVNQTYPHIELVVVDDGSTDGTRSRVDAYRDCIEIRYVRHDAPRGIAASMNDGVRNATGDFIAFLDHDDSWFLEFLETQVDHLLQHPDVGMVHADFQTIDMEGRVIEESVAARRGRKRPSGEVFPQLFMDSFIVGNSVLIRRECFTKLGLFDESLRWGDYLMWLRIARNYKVDYVDRVLTRYRQHPTQSTRTPERQRPDERPVGLLVIEKVLAEYPEVRQELGEKVIWRRTASFYFDLAYGWFLKGEMANARVCLRRAIGLRSWNRKYILLYAAALLPAPQSRAVRKAWRRLRGRDTMITTSVRGITG